MKDGKLLENIRNISKKKKIPLYVIEEKAEIAKADDVLESVLYRALGDK